MVELVVRELPENLIRFDPTSPAEFKLPGDSGLLADSPSI